MQKFRSHKSGGLKSEIVVRPSQIGRQIPSAYLYPCTTVMSRRAHAGARSGNSMVPLGSASSLLLAAIVLAGAPPAASSFSTTLPLHRCAPLPPSRCVGNSWRRNPSAQTPALAASTLVDQVAGAYDCASLALGPLFQPDASADVNEIVRLCDEIDELASGGGSSGSGGVGGGGAGGLRLGALRYRRYELLAKLMRADYDAYITTATFLGNRVARHELPNVQDVPYPNLAAPSGEAAVVIEEGETLVMDCEMGDLVYEDSLLDKVLLKVFRYLVKDNTGGLTSPLPGILGLVEQGRSFMLKPGQTAEAQQKMVQKTLGDLMTPVLPPFYRIFMTGIVPDSFPVKSLAGKQIGPWFYAPFLTSFVTPLFFAFLVGPSRINRRKDGHVGGLNVEKCKFLQESGCKGICLHMCKLPAQQFFKDELGLPLTVSPNFVTQECQWSFGQEPLPPDEDPSFPKGCLVGCESRRQVAAMGDGSADLCSV